MTQEELPLAVVFREVLSFLATRDDAVLFGAQAVNAYCEDARMTMDVDVLSTSAGPFAEAVREHLATCLGIAVRVREIGDGVSFRIYQLRKPKNRHLVDVRAVSSLPPYEVMQSVRVVTPVELVVMKVIALAARRGRPKSLTDLADIQRLLLVFPELKVEGGAVAARLQAAGASENARAAWLEVANTPIEPDDDTY